MAKEIEPSSTGIVIGEADVDPELPSHVAGVHEGNWPFRARAWRNGARHVNSPVSGSPRRSTGISAAHHGPIDPRMPKLTPP